MHQMPIVGHYPSGPMNGGYIYPVYPAYPVYDYHYPSPSQAGPVLNPTPSTPIQYEMEVFTPAYPEDAATYKERANKHEVQLMWTNLELWIKSKQILKPNNGVARPGRLFAIMGPSGSGKTSLLHCLAGRRKGMTGDVYLNSEKMTGKAMRHNAGFVPQDDLLFAFLTVEESIRYAAALQLPLGRHEREAAVEEVIQRSGLDGVRSTKVGSVVVRGVSGGEKRRVSIATEAVGDKPILFLDEPTSGLDSAAAFFVVEFLHRLARENGTTVICTIHQPSAKVFDLFDDLLILAYGDMIYCGLASQLGAHLKSLGHSIPHGSSPVEFTLDFINADFAKGDEKEAMKDRISAFAVESMAISAMPKSGVTGNEPPLRIKGTSFFRQLSVLLSRGLLNAVRNWIYYWVRMAMLGMLAILAGTIWFNLGNSFQSVQNRFGVLFFGVAFCCFMAVAGIPAFLEERSVIMREVQAGYYGCLSYVVSSTIVMVPFLAVTTMVYCMIAYWLQQLNQDVGRFFVYYGIFFLAMFVAEAVMLVFPALIPIFVIALTFASFFNGFVMMVMGFFVQYDNIPKFWIWAYYLAYQKYAFEAMCKNEFDGLVFQCQNNSDTNYMCSCYYVDDLNTQCQFRGETVLKYYGYEDTNIVCWAMVLLGMAFGYRIIFWLLLEWRACASLK